MAGLPDKWVRKAIHDVIHNIEVDGISFPCYTEQTSINSGDHYSLLSTQLNQPAYTKCGRGWTNQTEIQVIVRVPRNQGSKLLIDNACDLIIAELDDLQLDPSSGMRINNRQASIDTEFVDSTLTQVVYRKIIRLETSIT